MAMTPNLPAGFKLILFKIHFALFPKYGLSVLFPLSDTEHNVDVDLSNVDPLTQHCFLVEGVSAN